MQQRPHACDLTTDIGGVVGSWWAASLWQSPGTMQMAMNPASAAQNTPRAACCGNPSCHAHAASVPTIWTAAEQQDRLSDRKVAKRIGDGVQTSKFQAYLHEEGGEPAACIRMAEAVGADAGDGALRRKVVPAEHERVPVWLKRDDAPASADHARHFPHHRTRVVHVSQCALNTGTHEDSVCEGKRMGISGDEFRAAFRSAHPAYSLEHACGGPRCQRGDRLGHATAGCISDAPRFTYTPTQFVSRPSCLSPRTGYCYAQRPLCIRATWTLVPLNLRAIRSPSSVLFLYPKRTNAEET